ncbi:MAG: alpha/beta hydrolase [Hyphomicrobiales bacterium]|nr:MAG: alpha/beta hydrolase [Hyphomicrobiales bacterium]
MSATLVEVEPGVRVNVLELGVGDPVLLIHGWSLSSAVWDRQIRVLAETGHRVLAMDLRGHGGSDAPLGGYDIDRLAADGAAVLEALGAAGAAVVGWSLGGMTALRMAYRYPALVERLVLVASNGVAGARQPDYPFGVPADAIEGEMHAAEHANRLPYRRRAVGDPFGVPPDEQILDWLHRISLQTPSWAANACMTTLLRTAQVDILGDIDVPVTQIIGTSDPALSVRGARWVHERISSALVELDCGHYPMLERADAFDAALLQALRKDPGPTMTLVEPPSTHSVQT